MLIRRAISSFISRSPLSSAYINPSSSKYCRLNLFGFSSSSQKLREIFQKINIEVDNKLTNILDAGIISTQHLDP